MKQRRILEGIRVLDFTRVVAGPYTTRVLADLGAEVIKVDQPPASQEAPARTAGSVANNLGKRSIAINLKTEVGLEVALALAARADVLVENFRPGVMAELGLGYERISKWNPRVIFASISGFGQSGPSSHRRAYGATAHAEDGWLWVQQETAENATPFAPGVTVADIVTAMNAVSGILAVLYDRERTGRGQWIDVTLMESQLAMLSEVARGALSGEPEAEWRPFRHPIHAARDGYVTINIGGAHNWMRIAEALGHAGESIPSSPEAANQLVGPWVAAFNVGDLARRMEETGAPYGIMRSMHEALNDLYFKERGMIVDAPDHVDGTVRVIGSPLHFSDAQSGPQATGAPLAGQHSREILFSIGRSLEDIKAILGSGAIVQQDVGGK